MSTDLNPASSAVEDPTTLPMASTALPAADKTAVVTKVRYLECELFDENGDIRRRVTPARAKEIVALINDLRHALGWLEIDSDGRWRWPGCVGAASTSRQRVALLAVDAARSATKA
jgi:hypothetical protein